MTSIVSCKQHKDPRMRTYFLRHRLYWPVTRADQHLSFSARQRQAPVKPEDAAQPAFSLAQYLLSIPGIRLVEPHPFHTVVGVASAKQWTTVDVVVRRAIDTVIRDQSLESLKERQFQPVFFPAR